MQANVTMDKLVALCKNRGFVFAGSEIYGGLSNTWDYGPLGVELCGNIKKAWWKRFVQESPYNVGMDSAILMNPQTWVASGHVGSFSDPLMDCKACKSRFRADKLIEDYAAEHQLDSIHPDGWTNEQMQQFIAEHGIVCPECGKADFTPIRKFNLMFKTFQGVTEDTSSELYLRPETCQGIFVNFRNVQRTTRKKIPFGICQIGKSFRNEITPGNFVFRTREFEQMEMEFFCAPGTDLEWYAYWKEQVRAFLLDLGIDEARLRFREHEKEELSHYSRGTTDAEFLFPFGWGELWGVADRGDFDLNAHSACSGESFEYLDPFTNERYVPCCVEPSVGVGRLLLAFLTNAYEEEQLEKESRVVLHLHPALAPFKAAVLPLSKKLAEPAMEIHNSLSKLFAVDYDDVGSIGKRYRREDEIGTPFCVTVDFETENDGQVTLRNRDDMTQIRLPVSELGAYIARQLDF